MNLPNQFLLWFLLFWLLLRCNANLKTWNSNNNYDNINNWNLKRLPCRNDRVKLAEDSVIFVNQKFEAAEIVFPKNGEIIFSKDATLNIGYTKSEGKNCQGADIEFLVHKYNWYDPGNWNQSLGSTNKRVTLSGRIDYGNPIPHSERIPCPFDDVVFPINMAFNVYFNIINEVKIKSLKVGNKQFNSFTFQEFISSENGRRLFKVANNERLLVDSNFECKDISGCSCGNDHPLILNQICSRLSNGCPINECSDPVKPEGHCCDVCASFITIDYRTGFSYSLFRELINLYQDKNEFRSARLYMHKLVNSKIQLIIVDTTTKGVADKMAKAITKYLKDGPGVYAIKSVTIESSTDWNKSSPVFKILFTFLILVILVVSGVFGFKYLNARTRISSAFAFVRFHNERVELEMGTTPHEDLDPNDPIVGFSKKESDSVKETIQFKNPVFGKTEDEQN